MTSPFPDERTIGPTERAARRLHTTIEHSLGAAAPLLTNWLGQLLGESGVATAFLARQSHPLAHLPVWAADSAGAQVDETLIEDLAYSSMNGYFFIRLIDDVMDGDALGGEARLLPGLALLHTEFADVYHRTFRREHPFWDVYRREWMGTAEAAICDAHAETIDRPYYAEVTARKTRALLIPIAATLHVVNRPDLIEAWAPIVRGFGAWQQYYNDFFGWAKDALNGATTLILSESERNADDTTSADDWIFRHGVEWSAAVLSDFELETRSAAREIAVPGLDEYLSWRFTEASKRLAALQAAIEAVPGLVTG